MRNISEEISTLHGGKILSASEIVSLGDIDEKYMAARRRNDKIRSNRMKVRAISGFVTVTIFLIGFFSDSIYGYFSDTRENERISQIARGHVNPEPNQAAGIPVNLAPVNTDRAAAESGMPLEVDFDENDEAFSVPLSSGPRALMPAIKQLREEFNNDDIVGYIKIDGTAVNYMVAQATDNEYYLGRDIFGQSNRAGTIFMDYESNPAQLSRNTVIYGHNMRNGTMFHNLRYYKEEQFFNDHKYIRLTTLHEETVWEVFAFYIASVDFNYIQVNFPSDEHFAALLNEMKSRSVHKSGLEVGTEDHILTLSTCRYAEGDLRFVVNAKLISRISVEEL